MMLLMCHGNQFDFVFLPRLALCRSTLSQVVLTMNLALNVQHTCTYTLFVNSLCVNPQMLYTVYRSIRVGWFISGYGIVCN